MLIKIQLGPLFLIRIELFGVTLGEYILNPITHEVTVVGAKKLITAYGMRNLHKILHHLPFEKWPMAVKTVLSVINPSLPWKNNIDLHTHFTGALKGDNLIRNALMFKIPYPIAHLEEMGIEYKKENVVVINGVKVIPLQKGNIFVDGHLSLALQNEKNIIVEMNPESNFALENIQDMTLFQQSIKNYLKNNVRVTLGSDGHGLYNGPIPSVEAVVQNLGPTSEDWSKIQTSNESYVEEMENVFQEKMSNLKIQHKVKSQGKEVDQVHCVPSSFTLTEE